MIRAHKVLDHVEQADNEIGGAQAQYMVGGCDVDQLLEVLAALRLHKELTQQLIDYVEAEVVTGWGDPKAEREVEAGKWVVKSGSRRVFREHESVMGAIVAEGLDLSVEEQGAVHAIAKCLPASVGWKVGALRDLGIDPDDFSEWERGRRRVVFVPADEREAE